MGNKSTLVDTMQALDYYRAVLSGQDNLGSRSNKKSLATLRKVFETAKENKTEILIEDSEVGNATSVLVTLDYVGDTWCKGYEVKRYYGEEIRIPHVISYADVFVNSHNYNRNQSKKRVLFKGENPFE